MKTCPKCRQELSDDAKYCNNCGAKIFETIFDTDRGTKADRPVPAPSRNGWFTQADGLDDQLPDVPRREPDTPGDLPRPPHMDPPPKAPGMKTPAWLAAAGQFARHHMKLLLGSSALVVVAIIIAFVIQSFGRNQIKLTMSMYMKDKELFFTDLKQDGAPWQLTSRLVDTDEVSDKGLEESGYYLSLYSCLSKDGKYIFFPDKVGNDYGINLYFKEVNKPYADAVKIDSSVRLYAVNSAATLVTYLKGEESNLYQYRIGEDSKDKIAGDVRYFDVSDDGSQIVWVDYERNVYLKQAGREKEKIASEISNLEYVDPKFTTFYYTKDGSIYKQVVGKDKVKIASDIYGVLRIYDSGEMYYTRETTDNASLMDYVADDMKAIDAAIEFPYRSQFATTDEYLNALEAYNAKKNRDELRASLQETSLGTSSYALCYFNGADETVVADAFVDYQSNSAIATDAAVIAYEAYNQSGFSKVRLSEVDSIYALKDAVKSAMYASSDRYIAVKGTATVVEQEKKATRFQINAAGTIVYYFDDIPDGKSYGELYRITIVNGVVYKPEVFDSDVSTSYSGFIDNDHYKYFKDYKNDVGELYINKQRIDYDVYVYDITYCSDLNEVFYYTDVNDERSSGTLKVNQNGKAVKIADDVHDFSVVPDGRVLYLYDYSKKYYKGELREWNCGETRKIDDDVVCIISIGKGKYRGYDYSGYMD